MMIPGEMNETIVADSHADGVVLVQCLLYGVCGSKVSPGAYGIMDTTSTEIHIVLAVPCSGGIEGHILVVTERGQGIQLKAESLEAYTSLRTNF